MAALAAAVALGCVTAALAIAQAALLATAVTDAFMHGAAMTTLGATLAFLAVVFSLRAATAWAQEWVALLCSASVKSTLRRKLLARAAVPAPGEADAARSGEIVILATRGLDALDAYFGRYLPQVVLSMLVPLVVIAALFTVDLVAALTVVLTLPLIPLFMALIGAATVRRRKRRWEALARLSHHFLDVVGGLPTLRVFGRAEAQVARLESVTDDYRRESMATLRVAFLSAFALELAATLSVALVAVGIGLRLQEGTLDLRTGLFALVLAPEAYLPMRQLGARFHASEEGLAAADAAFKIIEAPLPEGLGGTEPVPDLRGAEIRLEAVTVRQPGRDLLAPDGVTAVIRPGEVVAISGPSGSGKSTLLDVLLGLRSVASGSIALAPAGGPAVPLSALDREEWHRHVAWVPQRPFCFPGTVADNVRLAAPDATDGEVAAALAAVGLAGVDPGSALGEGGTGVSAGQRRRIGVARALLRRSELLLLDEPTAGLDEDTEATVLAAIRAAARDQNRAVVLVAHRPAALAVADRVVAVSARDGAADAPTPATDGATPGAMDGATPATPATAAMPGATRP